MSKHHIIPKIRGGNSNGNLIKIPIGFHQGWHSLFGELTPDEAIEFIRIVFLGQGMKKRKKFWTQQDLYRIQLRIQEESMRKERKEKKKDRNKQAL